MVISRRDFIKVGLGGAGYFSTAGLVPNWIIRSAQAIEDVSGEGRILVIVQLEGGNDGINTVIPHTDPLYSPVARPTLHVPPAQAISVDALNSFHPTLADLVPWFDSGRIAVIQNVGYPNPDLSHFISTDYWEQGRAPAGPDVGTLGWMGRYFDETYGGDPNVDPLTMVGAGASRIPGSLNALTYSPPAIRDINSYRILGAVGLTAPIGIRRLSDIHALNDLPTVDSNVDFIQKTSNVAEASIEVVQNLSHVPPPGVTYPDTKVGRDFSLCSKIIHQPGIAPRILHVRQAGYDTHADQNFDGNPLLGDHPALLSDLNDALAA
ncbi:hypothetical protein IIC65_07830, partial [Candidatus Sumerlaeota bacterium]|nr:hypothetical protein [Candidatus Sumerlaeota bacterium]